MLTNSSVGSAFCGKLEDFVYEPGTIFNKSLRCAGKSLVGV